MKNHLSTLTATAALLSLSACGPVNDMKAMKSTTNDLLTVSKEMNQKMEGMQQATNQMADVTRAMNKSTDAVGSDSHIMSQDMTKVVSLSENMGKDTRTLVIQSENMGKDTHTLVEQSGDLSKDMKQVVTVSKDTLKTLMGMAQLTENGIMSLRPKMTMDSNIDALEKMDKAESLEVKMLFANIYMNAFEFQQWSNSGFDDMDRRQDLSRIAVSKFFLDVKNDLFHENRELLTPEDAATSFPPTSSTSSVKDNKLANIYALAVALHEVGYNQKAFAKANSFEAKSLLDFIKDGTRAYAAEKKSGKSVEAQPAYIDAVKTNIKLANMILQMRYTVFVSILLKNLSNIDAGFVKKISMANSTWTVDYTKLDNSAGARLMIQVAQGALDARKTLLEMGSRPADPSGGFILTISLSDFIKKMDVGDTKGVPGNYQAEAKQLQALLAEIKKAYQ